MAPFLKKSFFPLEFIGHTISTLFWLHLLRVPEKAGPDESYARS